MTVAPAIEQKLLDGKKVSQQLLAKVAQDVTTLRAGTPQADPPRLPKLMVVLVGSDPASHVYVNRKAKVARELGLVSDVLVFPAEATQAEVIDAITLLNADLTVHAILVQCPLPKHMDTIAVQSAVDPHKDVDGFHPANLGRLLAGNPPSALPCTPAGILYLLKAYNISLATQDVVVVGRSNIVGKPMGILCLQEDATVTFCHRKTRHLSEKLREADIIIAAVGIPEMITAADIKPGGVVVDVGINRRADGTLVGDVAFEAVAQKAAYITPVPGGVGPMTIAMLMANTLALYREQQRQPV